MEPVVVAVTSTDSEATVIQSLLEGYSIPSQRGSDLPHHIYPLSGEGVTQIRIYVPSSLADEARRVLDAHRRRAARMRLVDPR